jgi:hypothetical protein
MLDKLKDLKIINIIAMVIILTCSGVTILLAATNPNIADNIMRIIDKYYDMGLVGVVGWAFTTAQKNIGAKKELE